jgi:glycosyltransferase involved in cell wall biosynthesis
MKDKIRVLFMQSQIRPWSFANVHSQLMRYYDRECVEVHVACSINAKGEKTPSFRMLEAIPDLHIRPTYFGPTRDEGSKADLAKGVIFTGVPAIVSMSGLISYIKQHHIDIVHAAEKSRDASCGALVAKFTGIKSIFHLHAKCGSWMSPPVQWAMKQADGIIGVSQYGAQVAIDEGYEPNKIHHVLNSIDASRWNYNADGNEIRREFGIAPHVPVFAVISQIVPWKGHILLLKALAEIKNEIPDFRLLIVGKDDQNAMPKGSRSYTEVLQEKVHELDLSRYVIFTGLRSDIQQILAACDIYTMPAVDEPFGLAFLEAMAMRKAVIALESGGTPELVEHSKTGLLSPPEDAQQLAENILTLVNNPEMGKQMGVCGRKRVEEYFNPQRMADDVEKVYRLVLSNSIKRAHPHIA